MRHARLVAILLLGLTWPGRTLTAQAVPEPTVRRGARAVAFETLGGIAGSLAGVGGGLLIAKAQEGCDVEDLACGLEQAATTGVVSIAGATAGTYLMGRAANTAPSFIGSLLGSIAGAAAGVGMIHLLTEEMNVAHNNATLVAAYSVTQGIVTALGSRLLSRRSR